MTDSLSGGTFTQYHWKCHSEVHPEVSLEAVREWSCCRQPERFPLADQVMWPLLPKTCVRN